MNCEYVRNHYHVPAQIGRRVIVNGNPGIIAEDRGHHLGVLFDGDQPGIVYPCHPTWKVQYLGIDKVRRLSTRKQAAKERYRRFLEYGDSFDCFRDFLKWDSDPARSWNGGTKA